MMLNSQFLDQIRKRFGNRASPSPQASSTLARLASIGLGTNAPAAKPPATPADVAQLEGELAACLSRALGARRRLSAARREAGVRDTFSFFTKREVAEIRAENKGLVEHLCATLVAPAPAAKIATPQQRAHARAELYRTKPQAVDDAAEDWVATPARVLAAAAKARAGQPK